MLDDLTELETSELRLMTDAGIRSLVEAGAGFIAEPGFGEPVVHTVSRRVV
jgi:hypothetical protein